MITDKDDDIKILSEGLRSATSQKRIIKVEDPRNLLNYIECITKSQPKAARVDDIGILSARRDGDFFLVLNELPKVFKKLGKSIQQVYLAAKDVNLKGQEFFADEQSIYFINPIFDHISCLKLAAKTNFDMLNLKSIQAVFRKFANALWTGKRELIDKLTWDNEPSPHVDFYLDMLDLGGSRAARNIHELKHPDLSKTIYKPTAEAIEEHGIGAFHNFRGLLIPNNTAS